MNKTTQKNLVFYKLYKRFRSEPGAWISVWEFVGEIFLEEFESWELMSYTSPHRVFEVFSQNPGLIERQMTTGKSGARYYQYRIAPDPTPEKILDAKLYEFYKKVKDWLSTA